MSKSNTLKKGISIFMVGILLVSVFFIRGNSTVSAESLEDLRASQSALQNKQDKLKKEIADLEDKEAKQLELQEVLETKIASLEKEIALLNDKIDELKKEIKQLEEKKEEDIKKYKERLREMYMSDDDSSLNAILNSESFSDYLVTQDAIDRIYQQNEKMLQELVNTIQEIEEKKNEVEQDKAVLDGKKSKLDEEQASVIQLLRDIKNQKVKSQAEMDEIQKDRDAFDKKIAEKLRASNSGSNANRVVVKGGWALPVGHSNPYISCLFGPDSLNGYYRFHNGLDITGGGFSGTGILAAKDGVVVEAGWDGSYGNYVVINHGMLDGESYATLYAHMSGLAVSSGQEVKQGQTIGYGGNTGLSFGAHLHYEVRIDGSRVDPEPYLPYALPRNLV